VLATLGVQTLLPGPTAPGRVWAQTSEPTPPLPTELLPGEAHTVRLFEAASPAIVNVDVTRRRVDPWSRRSVDVPAGSGSGFLWDDAGHVVTNFHVIRRASGATITFDDQTQLDAELVGTSPDHDLAVLKVDLAQLPANADAPAVVRSGLPIGRSGSLRVGQSVYAIGNPFGLDHTLTTGVVSALDREIQSLTGRTLDGVVQTDAAINPGNSGGPLLDSAGRVVGVNTMIFSPSGASAGVGFAIPIDTVRRVVPQLIEDGRYQRPTLGIRIDDRVAAPILRRVGKRGVLVLAVQPDGPAAEAGLRPTVRDRRGRVTVGDIVLAVDRAPIESTDDLLNRLERRRPGDTVTLDVWRDGNQVTVQVTLR
jgi:S1-C subfamily serine protease